MSTITPVPSNGALTIHSKVAILPRVNKRSFIHVFLIVALCYGQLAANVHMAGHLEGKPEVTFSSFAVNPVEHHSHADHQHGHPSLTDLAWAFQEHAKKHHLVGGAADSSGNGDVHNNFDCAIYHAYLGQGVCLFTLTSGLSSTPLSVVTAPKESTPALAQTPHHHPIRGPPNYS